MTQVLSDDAREVLAILSQKQGVSWLTGKYALTAISLANTKLIALGPDEDDGSVSALITDEGRAVLLKELLSGE